MLMPLAEPGSTVRTRSIDARPLTLPARSPATKMLTETPILRILLLTDGVLSARAPPDCIGRLSPFLRCIATRGRVWIVVDV